MAQMYDVFLSLKVVHCVAFLNIFSKKKIIYKTSTRDENTYTKVKINKIFEHKIVNIFLPISFNMCFGCKNIHLIETVLLSTHYICLVEK